MNTRFATFTSILIVAGWTLAAPAAETPAQHEARLAWWRSARFGMFIHWGPVSLTGQEISWSRANTNTNCPNHGPIPAAVYDNLYKQFNPTNFNADDWVATARTAGMKYMVLTAKHADGFLLWPSQADPYNIGATPFHRDVCAELAAAAHRQGEPIGWYFSPVDWRDPDCRSIHNDRFVRKNQAELRELLSNYGQICLVWFDCDGMKCRWDPDRTYALVRRLQPQILIDNRLQMDTHEQWVHQGNLLPNEDYYTPEQQIGAYDDRVPWETCMTLGTQWSWKPEDKIKTAGDVEAILARCAGGDGNLLLDVGPMPDGRIEPRQVEVLRQVGTWLDRNGDSIYGTRGGPWKPTASLASTRKGNVIYLHVLRASDGAVDLPDLGCTVQAAALADGTAVGFAQAHGRLTLTVPTVQEAGDVVVRLTLADSAMRLPATTIPPEFTATASDVYQQDEASNGAALAFDGDPATRWATDAATRQAWVAVRYARAKTVGQVSIVEAYPNRVRQFEFQYRDGVEWKTIFSGTTLGDHFQKTFEPVAAQEFRLNILDASEGPTISEISLAK